MIEHDRLRRELEIGKLDSDHCRCLCSEGSERQEGNGRQQESVTHRYCSFGRSTLSSDPALLDKAGAFAPLATAIAGSADAEILVWHLLVFAAVLLPAPRFPSLRPDGSLRSVTSMAIMTRGRRSPQAAG
jgi:hypothetical protein